MQAPITAEKRNEHKWTSIIVGAVAVLIVIGTFLLAKNIDPDLRIYLRILFALGIGGLSAALIGSITLNAKAPYEIMAAGGFAVFLIIYLVDPKVTPQPPEIRIQLADKKGNLIASNDISVKLNLAGNLITGQLIPDSRAYAFNQLAPGAVDKAVVIYVESPQWTLDSGKKSITIKLSPGNNTLTVVRDTMSLMLTGRAQYDGKPLVGATVTVVDVNGDSTKTNDRGWFSLRFPDSKAGQSALIQIIKDTISYEKNLKLGEWHDIVIPKKS
ncbi:MAG: hypothetical protein EOO01_31935 [Chitinophagaceae bacterium]|nr:MAG: hypothetical protein EOO01_31935 [Chitinophagaceae bacterium]